MRQFNINFEYLLDQLAIKNTKKLSASDPEPVNVVENIGFALNRTDGNAGIVLVLI